MCLAGCRSDSNPPSPGEGFSAPDTGTVIGTAAQLAPGDTASILTIMQQTISEIDGALGEMTRRDTIITTANPNAPQKLSLWLQGDRPRKLTITEPNEVGEMNEESSVWFVDDEARVVVRPFDGYFLEGGRILVWTNGTLDPHRDVSSEDRMAREAELADEVTKWLSAFGVVLP